MSRVVTTIAGIRTPDPGIQQTPGANQYVCQVGPFSCVSPAIADGYGLAAQFGSPRYMAADGAGNLFITDTNGQAIRSYNLSTGWVGTFVGGFGYQDGIGAAVRVNRPRGMISDGTSIYFNEQVMNTVRQVIIQTAETSTLAGVRGCGGNQDGVGGDGTINWSTPGCGTAPGGLARFGGLFGAITYHYASRSILLIENGNLRRIE